MKVAVGCSNNVCLFLVFCSSIWVMCFFRGSTGDFLALTICEFRALFF